MFTAFPPAVTMPSSMAAKEKTSWLTAWLAPILLLLAALPASALTARATETRAWGKSSAPLESRPLESLQLLNLHQPKAIVGDNDALGSPLAAESAAADLQRPYVRNATRQTVEDAAPRTADGRPIDPNTRQPIDGTPDLGHKTGQEFWRLKEQAESEGLTQKQFNDRMNDPSKYQLEDPSSNRSHRYEQP